MVVGIAKYMGSVVQRSLQRELIGSATFGATQSRDKTHKRLVLVVFELLEANVLLGHLTTQVLVE